MSDTYVIKENLDGSLVYLHDIQSRILEILIDFDKICKEHNIEYALAYGTVLGAVRHKGFIPWDDDIDVMMDYKNYDKLVQVLSTQDIAPYYFHCNDTDDLYNATICEMKFRLENTKIVEQNFLLKNRCEGDGMFIDVFIIDSISESVFKHKFLRLVSFFLVFVLVITDLLGFRMIRLKNFYRSIGRRNAQKYSKSNYVGVQPTWIYDGFKDDRIQRNSVFPFESIDFEGHVFPAPSNPQEYCERIYGESYMEYPPKEARKPKHIRDIVI